MKVVYSVLRVVSERKCLSAASHFVEDSSTNEQKDQERTVENIGEDEVVNDYDKDSHLR